MKDWSIAKQACRISAVALLLAAGLVPALGDWPWDGCSESRKTLK